MRQLVLDNFPDKQGLISISGEKFHYLRQVLRVKAGSMVNVRFPDGTLSLTTVAKIQEKALILQVCGDSEKNDDFSAKNVTRGVQPQEIKTESEFPVEYNLIQFLPRPQKFELIVRQATECGIKNIIPVCGEYSEKSSIAAMSENKTSRIQRIIREAMQQSGSPVQTKVHPVMSLNDAVEKFSADSLCFVLSERNEFSENLFEVLSGEKSKIKKICIAVGCEGGISPSEISFLREKGLFHSIHFAVNILRCETASLYGIAAVQSAVTGGKYGD